MPRAYLYDVVLGTSGVPVTGASVQVNTHGGGAATLFTTEAGGVTAANPLITGTDGSFSCWIAEGTYDLVISGSGLTPVTIYRDAIRSSNEPGATLTTTGDLPYASSANTIARLGIGSSGNVLQVLGGLPSWGSVPIASLAGYPTDATKYLRGDGTWGALAPYRKTSTKTVNTTTAETDLLNGEITVAANAIGASGVLRLTAWGDWKQNSGAAADAPRFKLKLGATTLIDTGVTGGNSAANAATRLGWRICGEVQNLGATNSQWATLNADLALFSVAAGASSLFVTGEGVYGIINASTGGIKAFGSNSGAVDTTASLALVLSVINASASATYETVLKGALVEIL